MEKNKDKFQKDFHEFFMSNKGKIDLKEAIQLIVEDLTLSALIVAKNDVEALGVIQMAVSDAYNRYLHLDEEDERNGEQLKEEDF